MCRTTSADSETSQLNKMVPERLQQGPLKQTVITGQPEQTIGSKRTLVPPEKPAKKTKSTPKPVGITKVLESVEPRGQEKVKLVTQKQFTAAVKKINQQLAILVDATTQSRNMIDDEPKHDDSCDISHVTDNEGKVTLPCGERVLHSYIVEAKDTTSQSCRIKKIMSAMWTQSEMGSLILKHHGVQTENKNYRIMPQEDIERIKKVYNFLEVNQPLKNKGDFNKNCRSWISEKLRQCRQYSDPEKRQKIHDSQVLASLRFKEKQNLKKKDDESNECDNIDKSSSETGENNVKNIEERVTKAMNLMIASDCNYRTGEESPPVTMKKLASTLRVDIKTISEITDDCLKTKNIQGVECYRLISATSELEILTSMLDTIGDAIQKKVSNLLECETLERICANGTFRLSPKMIKFILSKYMSTDSSGR